MCATCAIDYVWCSWNGLLLTQVIFEHPNYLPGPQVPGLPPFAADFLLDTVRAATVFVSQALPAPLIVTPP